MKSFKHLLKTYFIAVPLLTFSIAEAEFTKMVFSEFAVEQGILRSALLDGSNLNEIPVSPSDITSIAIDSQNDQVYWTETRIGGAIKTAKLDGTGIQTLLSSTNPHGIALDVPNNKLYYTEGFSSKFIKSANLDGSNIQNVIGTGEVGNNVDIAVDIEGGEIFWVETSNDVIRKANLDGSGSQTIVNIPSSGTVTDITLESEDNKIYWSDKDGRTIFRANYNGSAVEVILNDTLINPEGLIVDGQNGPTVYYCDPIAIRIYAFNIGTGVNSALITSIDGLTNPTDIALIFEDPVPTPTPSSSPTPTPAPEETIPTTPLVDTIIPAPKPGIKEVAITLEEFTIDFFYPESENTVVDKTPKIRYDATATRSDGVKRRVISKNNRASFRLPSGSSSGANSDTQAISTIWSVTYRVLAVINRGPIKKTRTINKLDKRLADLREEFRNTDPSNVSLRIMIQNMIQTTKTKRALAKTRIDKKTLRSQPSNSFDVS
ncbi:MAG: DUF5050 domain-containing protein [bacterium]|nr:DUF5050 domain-containing protein [bacterium]